MELVKLKKCAINDSADQKMPFLAINPYFFDILGVKAPKIKSWIVKSVPKKPSIRIFVIRCFSIDTNFGNFYPKQYTMQYWLIWFYNYLVSNLNCF